MFFGTNRGLKLPESCQNRKSPSFQLIIAIFTAMIGGVHSPILKITGLETTVGTASPML